MNTRKLMEAYCLPNSLVVQPDIYVHSLLRCNRLTVDRIQFDTTHFCSTFFKQLAITQPPQIKHAVQKRQAEFLFGRIAARFALQRLGVTNSIEINCDYSPKWPKGLHGSISHSTGEAIAIALLQKDCSGVGVDIEAIVSADTLSAMQDIVVSEGELQRLKAYSSLYSETILLTLVFSAKESFYKAAYPQIRRFFDFDVLSFHELNAKKRQMIFFINTNLNSRLQKGYKVVIGFAFLKRRFIVTECLLPVV